MIKFFNPFNYIRYFFRILFFYTNKNLFHGETPKYFTDGTVTSHIFGGSTDIAFKKSIADSKKEFVHPLYHEWRLYIACIILKMLLQKRKIKYVECGVGEGHTLKVFMNYIKHSKQKKLKDNYNRSIYLLMDTFSGVDMNLVPKKDRENKYITKAYGDSTLSVIKKRFSSLKKRANFIQGSIPSTLDRIPKKFNSPDFLHIDMNNPIPEVSAINFFIRSMKPGSILLLDDYSFASAKTQRQYIDRYFDKIEKSRPLTLPSGQGIYFF